MVDEIYDRMYQEGRAEFHQGIDKLVAVVVRELGKSLQAVHRFEWSAPWSTKAPSAKDVRCT